MDQKDLLLQIPAWGLFAILMVNLVLNFLSKKDEREAKKLAQSGGLVKPPTPEEIAAVIRDQQERQEILDSLRSGAASQARLAEALEHVASAQERIARSQDRQGELIERQASRTRALAEAVATSRETLTRLAANIDVLQRDTEVIFTHIGAARRAETTPPPPPPKGA